MAITIECGGRAIQRALANMTAIDLKLLEVIGSHPRGVVILWEVIGRYPDLARECRVPRQDFDRIFFTQAMTHPYWVREAAKALYSTNTDEREGVIRYMMIFWRNIDVDG